MTQKGGKNKHFLRKTHIFLEKLAFFFEKLKDFLENSSKIFKKLKKSESPLTFVAEKTLKKKPWYTHNEYFLFKQFLPVQSVLYLYAMLMHNPPIYLNVIAAGVGGRRGGSTAT